MDAKKWIRTYIISCCIFLLCIALLVITIDPYFHFHKPLSQLYYTLDSERYQNDGILKHFDYDAVITGTSMTENFKTSEFDALFDCHSVKTPFSGATFYELNMYQERALKTHTVKYMIRSLDVYVRMFQMNTRLDRHYPAYLYDGINGNDIQYLYNKDAVNRCIHAAKSIFTKKTGITSFDDYANWMSRFTFGKNAVLGERTHFAEPLAEQPLTPQEEAIIRENIQTNVIALTKNYPQTQFYYFFPPYSIAQWGELYEQGTIQKHLQAECIATQMMLDCENIHLFSFNTNYAWILNLDNYKDSGHYGEQINSEILRFMKNDEYRLTKENYAQHAQEMQDFYTNFDYNSIF